MSDNRAPYESPFKLPVLEPIQIIGAIALVLLNFGLWGWYVILAAYLLIPDAWGLW